MKTAVFLNRAAVPLLLTVAPPLPAQTLFDWNGGTGNWTTDANWSTRARPNSSSADVFIDKGDAANSAVTLLNSFATLGRLTIEEGDSLTWTNTSNPAQQFTLTMTPGAFAGSGNILNNGTFNINASAGHPLNLKIGDGTAGQTAALDGTGSLNLGDSTANQIIGAVVSQTFVNNSNITGAGTVGGTLREVRNTGTITATGVTNELILTAGNILTNTGTLRATAGSILRIQGTTGLAGEGLINSGGLVEADGTGAVVKMTVNRTTGGTLQTRNGGVIQWLNNNMCLDGSTHPVTISSGSDVRIPDGAGPDLKGTLIIDGTLTLDSTGTAARFQVADFFADTAQSLTLNGAGSVVMTNQTVNEINGTSGSTLTTNIPITGGGKIGGNLINVTNNSTITASGPAGITLDPQTTFTNNALGRATAGSTLTLAGGAFVNSAGIFRAEGAGAIVDVTLGEIQGGLLAAVDGGEVLFTTQSAFVNGTVSPVTLTGPARVTNADIPFFAGTVIVEGDLRVDSTGAVTSLRVSPGLALTLQGGGTVTLANNLNSQITGSSSSLTNRMLIQGAGRIGVAQLDITNGGVINANQTAGLTIDPRTTFINTPAGVVRSTAGGGITLNNGTYTNNGLIEADGGNISSTASGVAFTNYNAATDTLTGGTYRVNGPHTMALGGVGPVAINAAEVELSGTGSTFSAINSLTSNQGSFTLRNDRNFTTAGALTNSGTLRVDGTAVLTTSGNLALAGDTAALEFELGELPGSASYEAIQVNGNAVLDGKLRLIVAHSLATTLTGSETFTLLTANTPVTGAFDNVASGSRVADLYGEGSFVVHYGAGSPFGAANLVLTGFSPPPVIVSFSSVPGTGDHSGEKNIDVVIKTAPGAACDLEASTNCQDWTVVQSVTAAAGTGLAEFELFEPEATPRYFLRARQP